jgi:hypothetical protein
LAAPEHGDDPEPFLPYRFFQSIRDNRGLSSSAKLVALVLGTHAAEGKNIVYPSVQTISEEAGLSVDTVKYALAGLEKAGVQKPIGLRGKTRTRALFPARHDALSAGRPKRNMGGSTTLDMGGSATHKVITKINTDDDDSSGSGIDLWTATNERAPRARSVQRSVDDVAESSTDCDPLGRMQKLPPRGADLCPTCGCDENDPWARHDADCPDNPNNFQKY